MYRAEYLQTIDGLFSTPHVRVRTRLRVLVLAALALAAPAYSFRSATIGSTRIARRAGR